MNSYPSPTYGQPYRNDIILIGGGTASFFDRQRILAADYDYTPIYRSIARYDIRRKYYPLDSQVKISPLNSKVSHDLQCPLHSKKHPLFTVKTFSQRRRPPRVS